ncbi:TonB-dependent receptor [Brevundimonas sp. LM2]|uniref:TonB-dependent receptor domain-containing protein n=1 Tax=Brevundimonas sp. LM2 TaxID=1938605 RepID=UPI000983CFD6|nr:TonB-dependent receptor [Brevundimonas sp. LM2]AQR60800.1 TonB-dependent receptor [Brevundimonas sp. LM2]
MKTLSLTLSGVLLATSALIAPGLAYAQTAPVQQTPAQQAEPTVQESDAEQESTLDEIVVLGRYIPEPNRESSEVAAFVTAEDLQRTGDSNAAAALTRVTGLSVVEGRFIYVRGLGERYSSALLNGSPLPSPEPLQRVVPLDLFPANVLDSVTVQKTYSANFPGEFGGGVIDLQTIDAPNDPFFTMQVEIGGNTEATGQEGLTYFGSRTDFLGFDDDTRDIPGELALAFQSGNQIQQGTGAFTDRQLQQIGRSLNNAPLRLLQREENPVDVGLEVSGGFSNETPLGTLGVIAVAGYDNSWRIRQGFQEAGGFDAGTLIPLDSFQFASNQNDVQLNLLGGLSLSGADHELKWTNFYVRNTTKEARSRVGPVFDAGGNILRDDFTEWFVRELFSTQLAGEHDFMDGALELDWRAAYATTSRDAPYETRFSYAQNATGAFVHRTGGGGNLISFSELDDDVYSAGADVRYTLPLSELRDVTFAGGVAFLDNSRDSERRDLTFTGGNNLTQDQLESRVDYYTSDFNIGPNGLVLQEITGQNGAAAYDGELQVNAAYVSVEAEIIPLVTTTVGVRYEEAEQSVTTRDLFGNTAPLLATRLEEEYFLPAFTATWNFAEDMQLRLGASQTIGRPQFRELAAQPYTDPESDRTFNGNPFLVDTEILNLDARYEWYFDRQQFFTFGVFYKDLDKPVESTIVAITNTDKQQSFLNAPQAVIYGAEVEAKKYFEWPDSGTSFIANKRWLVQANYTYSSSEVKVESGDTVVSPGDTVPQPADFFIEDGSRLQGQSEHVANLQLGWEDDTARSQATIIVNYVSERITARGAGAAGNREPDFIQEPGVFLDFVYRKDFTVAERDLGFALELRNLLGTDFDEYQEFGDSKIRINNYDLGSSASVSLTARF